LLPQALTGNLPEAQTADDSRTRRKKRKDRDREIEPSIEKGILNIFVGLGFIVAALAVMYKFPAGIFWGWTFFIPGFQHLGRGVASIVAARRKSAVALPPGSVNEAAFPARAYDDPLRSRQLGSPAPQTNELMPHVPSVTEGTTRHLGGEAPTQHFDSVDSQKPS
jgi:hypothetical protein